jgi:membrane-bound lytic murein transglycosylase D
MKKFVWLNLFCWVMMSFAMAQPSVSIEAVKINPDAGTGKNAQAIAAANKEKDGFKDLFDNNAVASASGPRLNPRAVSFVQDYIEKYGDDLSDMKGWGRPYFNTIDAILEKHHLPKELKYLAVIESELHPHAVSWAGAVGPWQLMPTTARILGLVVNRHRDERTNYIKSTNAAARYLTDLYNQFGDWLLVIAAYNGGAGNVLRAIHKSGSHNFWSLQYYLPAESRNHVKKFIGTHYIFEGQGGVTTLTKQETNEFYGENGTYVLQRRLNPEEAKNAKSQNVSGKYNAAVIARYVIMDMTDFNRYNPDFDKVMASAYNNYEMKLPADKMDLFNANKYRILDESIQLMLNNATAAEVTAKDTVPAAKSTVKK